MNKNNLIDLEEYINEVSAKRAKLVLEKKDLETELSALNNKVRSATTHLKPSEYQSICRRQDDIKKKINKLTKGISEYKLLINQKETLKQKIKVNLSSDSEDSIIEKVIKLKDKYRDFASDATRVSSMRTMASQISQELEVIIKQS